MIEDLLKELEKIAVTYNNDITKHYYASSFDSAYRNGFNCGENEQKRLVRNLVRKYKRRLLKKKLDMLR